MKGFVLAVSISLLGAAIVCGDGSKVALSPTASNVVTQPATCEAVMEPKGGPLKLTLAYGTLCWIDITDEASYKVEGTVAYVSDCEAFKAGLPLASKEFPFAFTLPTNLTSFDLLENAPKPQDPHLTVNYLMVSLKAVDLTGRTIATDSTGVQLDDFCE